MNKKNEFEAIDVALTDEELKQVVGGVMTTPIINPIIGCECNYFTRPTLDATNCCNCEKE